MQELLQQPREGRSIKILVTIRDYAVSTIIPDLAQYDSLESIKIEPLSEKEIEEFVRDEYQISNNLYLNRISHLAQGNPRLAVMMARLAVEKNTLESIVDVSSLYETYFASIRRDVDSLQDDDTWRIAALVGFFRAVDRSNADLTHLIEGLFGVSSERFWSGVKKLHDLEAVDLYEEDIVKIPNQALANYFFYLAFFKKKLLDVSPLLTELFPKQKDRLIDALFPCLDAFDAKHITNVFQPHVRKAVDILERREGGDDLVLEFFCVFWFVDPTSALLRARSAIEKLRKASFLLDADRQEELQFEPDSSRRKPVVLQLLSRFRYVERSLREIAVTLLLEYVDVDPQSVPMVLSIFIGDYGFIQNSHAYGFEIESHLVELLWSKCEGGKRQVFSRMLLCVAERLLNTEYATRHADRRSVTVTKFCFPVSEPLLSLRKLLWSHLFELLKVTNLSQHVLGTIRAHASSSWVVSHKELIEEDARYVLPALARHLNPELVEHCVVVFEYFKLLKTKGVRYDKDIETLFRSRSYRLLNLLVPDIRLRKDMGRDAYEELKWREIEEEFAEYTLSDYGQFFALARPITQDRSRGHIGHGTLKSVFTIFDWLQNKNAGMFVQVLSDYLLGGNPLHLEQQDVSRLIRPLIDILGKKGAYGVIAHPTFPGRESWLFCYYQELRPAEISRQEADDVLYLYEGAEPGYFPHYIGDLLRKYLPHNRKLACSVVEIVLEHATHDPRHAWCLTDLFDTEPKASSELVSLFDGDIDLLKRAYFAALNTGRDVDHYGVTFESLLDIDSRFVLEYVLWFYERQKLFLSAYDDSRDYSFLWMRDDTDARGRT